MKTYWINVTLIQWLLSLWEICTETHRPWDGWGRDWDDKSTNPGWPRVAGSHQKRGEARFSSRVSGRSVTLSALWFWLVDTEFRLLASRVVREWILLFLSHQVLAICDSSLRKQIQGHRANTSLFGLLLHHILEKNNLTSQGFTPNWCLAEFLMDHSTISVDLNSLIHHHYLSENRYLQTSQQ